MNKKLLIPATVLSLVAVVSAVGVSTVRAQNYNNGTHPGAQALAEKFNLDQNEVENFFTQQRGFRHEDREERHEEHLNELVNSGQLTQEQRNALEARHDEMESEREEHRAAMSNLTIEERQAERTEHRAEMEVWAEENGIDLSILHPEGQSRGPMGKGQGFNKGF
jgi:hypothetical protein